jgi:hypothetical protein
MPSSLTIPRAVIPQGTQTTPSLAVPDGDTHLRLEIDRTVANGLNASPVSAVLLLYVDQSDDGGTSWTWIGGDLMTGGVYIFPKTGLEEDTDYIETNLNLGTSRLLRGRLINQGGGGSVAVAGSLATS